MDAIAEACGIEAATIRLLGQFPTLAAYAFKSSLGELSALYETEVQRLEKRHKDLADLQLAPYSNLRLSIDRSDPCVPSNA